LPERCPVNPTSLSVLSFGEQATPGTDGSFALRAPKAGNPQLLVASTENDDPVLLCYYLPDSADAVRLDVHTTAAALAMLNPALIGSSTTQREQFLAAAQNRQEFATLVATLESLLRTDPVNALDGEAHPEVFAQAVAVSVATLEHLAPGGTNGEDQHGFSPFMEDAAGSNVAFVNPTLVYYGTQVTGGKTDLFLVNPVPHWLTYRLWPPGVYETEPETTFYDLGDGDFVVGLYKGMDLSNTDPTVFYDWTTPKGLASLANTARGILHIVDIMIGYAPTRPVTALRLNSTRTGYDLIKMAKDWPDVQAVFFDFCKIIQDNSQEIAYWLWQDVNSEAAKRFLGIAANLVQWIVPYLKAYTVITDKLPFFSDLVKAAVLKRYTLTQRNGIIEDWSFATGPEEPSRPSGPTTTTVGVECAFQSSAVDPTGLKVALDFDWGDGTTPSRTALIPSGQPVSASHAWQAAGEYRVYASAVNEMGGPSVPSDPLEVTVLETQCVFAEHFESYPMGGIPSRTRWNSASTPPSALCIGGDGQGGKALQLADPTTDTAPPYDSSYAWARTTVSQSYEEVEFKFYLNGGNCDMQVRAWGDLGNLSSRSWDLDFIAGNLCYVDNQGVPRPVAGIAPLRWYTAKLSVNWQAKTYDIYLDGALKKSAAPFRGSSPGGSIIDIIDVYDSWTPTDGFKIDDIVLRSSLSSKGPDREPGLGGRSTRASGKQSFGK